MRYLIPAVFLALPAAAQERHDCVIEPFMVLEVGAAIEGIVESVNMTRGATVKTGDVLATLEAHVERETLRLAETQARSTVAVEIARSRVNLARIERDRAVELVKRNAGTESNRDLAEAALRQAELEVVQALEDTVLRKLERDSAQAILERRTVRSPINGVLLRRLIGPGEYVYSQAQIAQIATVDPLYVDVFLPTELYDAIAVGQIGTVRPAAPIEGIYEAEVTAIDNVFDAASDTFGVRLKMPNPDNLLPAGVDCTIEFPSG